MADAKAAPAGDYDDTPEALLRLHAIRLQDAGARHFALHVKLSHLQVHNRRPQHLQAARNALSALLTGDDDRLYELAAGDLVAVASDTTREDVNAAVAAVHRLFYGDPITEPRANGKNRFCHVYDLGTEAPAFIQFATKRDERSRVEYQRRDMKLTGGPPPSSGESKSLDAAELHRVYEALQTVDLRKAVKQQPICAIVRGAAPHAVLHELYVSIADLQEMIAPGYDLAANRSLFRYITQSLDRRMLDFVSGLSARMLSNDLTININVATVLSEEFTFFDRNLERQDGRALVLEIPIVDVFADTPAFMYARDLARERGYRVLVDGTHHLVAPFIDRTLLGVDFVKIRWNPILEDGVNGPQHKLLEKTVRAAGPNRVIFSHCDSPGAVPFGHAVGITLFQGFYVDALLKESRQAAKAKVQQRAAG